MIRIDEIYDHLFWPWIKYNRPKSRLFFCDPFGHTDPEHLHNFGNADGFEDKFIFMHDQEPIQMPLHKPLFDEVVRRNLDVNRYRTNAAPLHLDLDMVQYSKNSAPGIVITSEQGERVKDLETIYGWDTRYYFFHGWACLDWFRGYNRSFLFSHPQHRVLGCCTFMSPNRIIGGERDHRVIFLYHILKKNLQYNHISAPLVCPVENQHIGVIASKYSNRYADIEQVLSDSTLPWLFHGESRQEMTSCLLTNFQEAMQSLIYVPTETVYFGKRTHITEKTFKAIALGMPFILVATAGSLEYLRRYGFQTFDNVWSENYDEETNDFRRLEMVVDLLANIDACSQRERDQIWRHVQPRVEHNWNHFYHGGFESVLWSELSEVLNEL